MPMENRNPVGWFELPCREILRAQKFYESSFNFKLKLVEDMGYKMAWFPMHQGAEGSSGALVEGKNYSPSTEGAVMYFSVSSIDESLVKILQAGGKVLVNKTDIGEYGVFAHVTDTEGNRIGIHSNNKN